MAGMEAPVKIDHLLDTSGQADEKMEGYFLPVIIPTFNLSFSPGTENPDMWERVESVPTPKGQAHAPVNFDKQSRRADKQAPRLPFIFHSF